MNRHQTEFREALDAFMNARERVGRAIDQLLEPTTTGYRWAAEHWELRNVFEDNNRLILLLVPPERAYEWQSITVDNLNKVREAVDCEYVSGTWGADGKSLYRCSWPMPTVPL